MSNSKNNQPKIKGVESLPIMSFVFMGIGAVSGYLGTEIFLTSWPHHLNLTSGGVVAMLTFLSVSAIFSDPSTDPVLRFTTNPKEKK